MKFLIVQRDEKEAVMSELLREQRDRDDLIRQLEQEKQALELNTRTISDLQSELSKLKSQLQEETQSKNQILYESKRTKMEASELGNKLKQVWDLKGEIN